MPLKLSKWCSINVLRSKLVKSILPGGSHSRFDLQWQVVEYGQFDKLNAKIWSTQTFKMQSPSPNDARIAEIAKIAETKSDIVALQQHVKEVIEGEVFKGSHRSVQFLQYIVDKAITGHCESLKERVIGMELFGRSASYDTGDDAIVRVTASDVRRRLLEHYGRYGATSEFRITLPSGSYIPEITRKPNGAAAVNGRATVHVRTLSPDDSAAIDTPLVLHPKESIDNHPSIHQVAAVHPRGFSKRIWFFAAIAVVTLNLTMWAVMWARLTRTVATPMSLLPWSALFSPSHATQLITSDPNIVSVQAITGGQISVSDYANRKYVPEPNKLTPDEIRFCHMLLWGDNSTASVDTPIAVNIAELARTSPRKINVHAARSIQLTDLKTDDNFIILGSPRSDPWSSLFSDQLDFRFHFDDTSGQEIIRNVHPRSNEQQSYIPTALGWATGDSYAIIALVQNPDQSGHVLLLAGANGEGTEAAGKLVTDSTRFSSTLRDCGISPAGQFQQFEILLHLNTMAGSPNKVDVVACHILTGASVH